MHFESLASFIEMGGHGLYVWICYAIATAIISLNFIVPIVTKDRILKDIERQIRREQK